LIIIPSEKTNVSSLNPFLMKFGKIQLTALENKEKQITKINFKHPLFTGVFESKINNFQYPKVQQSFGISSSNSAVLYYEDQSAFLVSMQNQLSNVAVFSAPLNLQNTNFQQSPLIVPVFYKMALNNQNSGINALTIGNNTPFFLESLVSKDEILTVENEAEKFTPVQQIGNTKVKLSFSNHPDKAGNYSILNKKEALENISFNYDRTESDLSLANEDAVSDYKVIESIASVFDSIQTDRTDNQVWKWFVIFALLFLAVEMAIIRFVK
jgi:hypothetical protein